MCMQGMDMLDLNMDMDIDVNVDAGADVELQAVLQGLRPPEMAPDEWCGVFQRWASGLAGRDVGKPREPAEQAAQPPGPPALPRVPQQCS